MALGTLLRFAVKRMLPAVRAELVKLKPARVITPVLLGRVVPALAFAACQRNHRADVFLLGCHSLLLSLSTPES